MSKSLETNRKTRVIIRRGTRAAMLSVFIGTALVLPEAGAKDRSPSQDDEKAFRKRFVELVQKLESSEQFDASWSDTLNAIGELRIPASTRYLVARLKSDGAARHSEGERGSPIGFVITALGIDGTAPAVRALLTEGFEVLPEREYSLITRALGAVKNPEAVDWIVGKGWKTMLTLPAAGQVEFVRVLDALNDPRTVRPARTLVGKSGCVPEAQVILIQILARYQAQSAVKKIARAATSRSKEVQIAALLALRDLAPEEHSRAFFKALESRHWEVRATAVDILRQARQPELVSILVPLLEDESPPVRLATVRALEAIGGDDVMDALIAALSKSSGRLQDDIAETLVRLTGKDFGLAGPSWESWWQQHRGQVEIRAITRSAYDRLKEESEEASTGVYYGLRVISQFVTFVIDVSDSMKEPYHVLVTNRGGQAGGRTQVPGQESSDTRYVQKQKIEVAREELLKVLGGIRDGTLFNIVSFDTFKHPFKNELVVLGDETREEAIAFIKGLEPKGTTNVFDTLKFCLEDPQVNTIYFLSDGAPTAGSCTDPEEIRRRIAELNRLRKVKIHTIGFHLRDEAEELMRKLAEENYGRFVKM